MFTREGKFRRSWLVGLITFALSVAAVAAIWGVGGKASQLFSRFRTPETAQGKVSLYLLNGQGEVDGLLLENGDQVRFTPNFGKVVAENVKAGDEVSVNGHAGTTTNYGRTFQAQQITANGRTLVGMDKDRGPHGPKDGHGRKGPHGPGHGHGPDDQDMTEADTGNAATPPAGEEMKSTATISRFLVNPRGHVEGMILSDSTQVRFGPKLGAAIVAARQSEDTPTIVEGWGVRNERGVVIRPAAITVGTQTFALGPDEHAEGRRH